MKKIVIANLKMNMTLKDTIKYIKEIDNIDPNFIVCPSSIYIPYYLSHNYKVGIQNVSDKRIGSYTGEVSPLQAYELGCTYALVGHFECRRYLKEDDELINKKIINGLSNKLNIVLCIGEDLEIRKSGNTNKFIDSQLEQDLKDITNVDKLIIAYEPIWAIGTGVIPKNEEIRESISLIKEFIKKKYNQDIKVLYGGSVNDINIKKLNEIDNVDGYLIGSAATDSSKVLRIIEVISC